MGGLKLAGSHDALLNVGRGGGLGHVDVAGGGTGGTLRTLGTSLALRTAGTLGTRGGGLGADRTLRTGGTLRTSRALVTLGAGLTSDELTINSGDAALGALRTLRTSGTGRTRVTLATDHAGVTLLTLGTRDEGIGGNIADGAGVTSGTLRTRGTSITVAAGRTSGTRGAGRTSRTSLTLVTLGASVTNITLGARRTLGTHVTLGADITSVTLGTLRAHRTNIAGVTLGTLRTNGTVVTSRTLGTLRTLRTSSTNGARRTSRTLGAVGTISTLFTGGTRRTLASANGGNLAADAGNDLAGGVGLAATILGVHVKVHDGGVGGDGVVGGRAAASPVTSGNGTGSLASPLGVVKTDTNHGVGGSAVILLVGHDDTKTSASGGAELEVTASLVAVGLHVVAKGHGRLEVDVGEESLSLLEPGHKRGIRLGNVTNVALVALAELDTESTERHGAVGSGLQVTLVVKLLIGSPVGRVVGEKVGGAVNAHGEAPRDGGRLEGGPHAGDGDYGGIRGSEHLDSVAAAKELEVRRDADGGNLELGRLGVVAGGSNLVHASAEVVNEDLNGLDGLALLAVLNHPLRHADSGVEVVVEVEVVGLAGNGELLLGGNELARDVGGEEGTDIGVVLTAPLTIGLIVSAGLKISTLALSDLDLGEARDGNGGVAGRIAGGTSTSLGADVHASHEGTGRRLGANLASTSIPVTRVNLGLSVLVVDKHTDTDNGLSASLAGGIRGPHSTKTNTHDVGNGSAVGGDGLDHQVGTLGVEGGLSVSATGNSVNPVEAKRTLTSLLGVSLGVGGDLGEEVKKGFELGVGIRDLGVALASNANLTELNLHSRVGLEEGHRLAIAVLLVGVLISPQGGVVGEILVLAIRLDRQAPTGGLTGRPRSSLQGRLLKR